MSLRQIFVIVFFGMACACPGQNLPTTCVQKVDTLTHTSVFTLVDRMPEAEGGVTQLFQKIRSINPSQPNETKGKLLVAFIVSETGKIFGERILKDPSGGAMGRQVLDLIKTTKWTPANCADTKVAVLFTLPIIIDVK